MRWWEKLLFVLEHMFVTDRLCPGCKYCCVDPKREEK
jgi:hypothetical protein